ASSPAPRPPDAEGPAYWRSFQLVVSVGFPPGLAGPRWTVRSERQPAGRRSSRALASLEPSLGSLKPPLGSLKPPLGSLKPPLGSLKPSPWLAQAVPLARSSRPWARSSRPLARPSRPLSLLRPPGCPAAKFGRRPWGSVAVAAPPVEATQARGST